MLHTVPPVSTPISSSSLVAQQQVPSHSSRAARASANQSGAHNPTLNAYTHLGPGHLDLYILWQLHLNLQALGHKEASPPMHGQEEPQWKASSQEFLERTVPTIRSAATTRPRKSAIPVPGRGHSPDNRATQKPRAQQGKGHHPRLRPDHVSVAGGYPTTASLGQNGAHHFAESLF